MQLRWGQVFYYHINPATLRLVRARPLRLVANLAGQHTMAALSKHFDVHYTTVSRLDKARPMRWPD